MMRFQLQRINDGHDNSEGSVRDDGGGSEDNSGNGGGDKGDG